MLVNIRNPSGLQTVPIPGRLHHPDHSLTVVAKALFRLEPGQLTELLDDEELGFPTGDVPRNEDDEAEDPEICYPSDFVHFKPRTDLMLVGRCHAPGSEPIPSCRVTFQVGAHGRSLHVFGDRWWTAGGVGRQMTEPEPFTEMDLSWERAYGGPKCPDNPVGRGNEPVELEDGRRVWPLPNVEYPEQLISSPDDRPAPAGFGPMPMGWEPRRSKVGTYDDRWLESRWPWFAEDMDWRLFNAAPLILQPEGFMRGDEEIYLENLHPEEPHFRTRLPGIRVRCFVNELPEGVHPPPPTEKERQEWSPPPREEMTFREIPMSLDTVWVDAEEGLVALVWRGHGPARDQDYEEIRDIFLMAEPLSEPAADLDSCRASFWAHVDEEEGTEEEDEGEAIETVPVGAAGAAEEGPEATEGAGHPEGEGEEDEPEVEPPVDATAKLREDMKAMGIDPDDPPEPTEEEREKAKEFFREKGMDDVVALLEGEEEPEEEPEAPEPPWSRERVEEQYAENRDLADEDLRGLDLSDMVLEAADLSGADLTGAKLARTKLVDADLTGATLVRVDLTDAELTGASLAESDLTEARLPGADLTGADLTGARMPEANLTGADLTDALLEGAQLQASDLTDAEAGDAVFVEANLSGAVLIRGHFEAADFTGAILDRVDAREASFESAEFGQVRAVEAMLAGANLREIRAADALDLSRANLSQVEATESVWSGATLEEAVLAWAVLDGADFTGANLRGADFYAAHLREARFSKANLLDARLAAADAFEAQFDEADLARGDLRGGSFYAAEFQDVRFHETSTEGADLNMTKHG